MLREAVAERLPPLPIAPELAARLIEAQWQGAFNQWGFFREGRLPDFVSDPGKPSGSILAEAGRN